MKPQVAALLGFFLALSGWFAAGWPWLSISPVVLGVAMIAASVPLPAALTAAAVSGLLLGLPEGTSGIWVLALSISVLVVERIHRETLTHRTPAAWVLHAVTGTAVALTTFWLLSLLLSSLGLRPASAPIRELFRALLLAALEAAALVSLGRILRRPMQQLLGNARGT